jgi:hypothetical protein
LFAVWGGGDKLDMMDAARHKTESNAMRYREDATYLLTVAAANNRHVSSVVPVWKQIFCKDRQMGRCINIHGPKGFKPLGNLAHDSLYRICGVTMGSSIIESMRMVECFKRNTSTKEKIQDICKRKMDEAEKDELLSLIETYAIELRFASSTPTCNDLSDEASTQVMI